MAPLDDLAFFQQLARAGSLTATARELGISLSAVSKRLKQLEARLGVSLAARTTRRLTLTAEGERYLAQGSLILDELDALESDLRDAASQGLQGRLRVNATFGFGRRHIAPLLSRFCVQHPGIESWLELTNFPSISATMGSMWGFALANRRIHGWWLGVSCPIGACSVLRRVTLPTCPPCVRRRIWRSTAAC